MKRVHIWGASGYAAAEAMRLCDAHPHLELGALESRSHAGQEVSAHFPLLRKKKYQFTGEGSVLASIAAEDVVIAAGAHGEAKHHVPAFIEAGARVVDLSADYRLDERVAYGLSEWNRSDIAQADLVANPGCYPTATLLGLLPLVSVHSPVQLIVDAKSGITGAGRNPSLGALYAEVSGDIRSYGLDMHRHQPEIERILTLRGTSAPLVFTPHVVPLVRGMLADSYAIFDTTLDASDVLHLYHQAYADSSFITLISDDRAPSVSAVTGTNDVEIRVDVRGNVVRIISAIDNLGKGAAGQALQNINIMLGYPEETGFYDRAVVAG
jgi:N-acetyl-gamma-glutamyl-phosphate reductase